MPDMIIRPLRAGDSARLADIAVRAWRAIHDLRQQALPSDLYRRLHADWAAKKSEAVRRFCAENPDWVRVALVASRVVGFITFTLDRKSGIGEIGNNAVEPAFQGRGIATSLYGEALACFRQAGLRYAAVHTGGDPGHAPARRAYEKAGFNIQVPTVCYYMDLAPVPTRARRTAPGPARRRQRPAAVRVRRAQ